MNGSSEEFCNVSRVAEPFSIRMDPLLQRILPIKSLLAGSRGYRDANNVNPAAFQFIVLNGGRNGGNSRSVAHGFHLCAHALEQLMMLALTVGRLFTLLNKGRDHCHESETGKQRLYRGCVDCIAAVHDRQKPKCRNERRANGEHAMVEVGFHRSVLTSQLSTLNPELCGP